MIGVSPGTNIKVNYARFRQNIMPYLLAALDQATDLFVAAMKRHVNDKVTANSPGEHKPSWSGELDSNLKK